MPKKPARSGRTNNKAKQARRGFKAKTANYKSDHQSVVCSSFIDTNLSFAEVVGNTTISSGALVNTAAIVDNAAIELKACIALDARSNIFASHRHGSMVNLFNEWNTSAVYLDLLFSPELRKNCDQVFLLVERGVSGTPTNVAQMVSDVNCRMYQLGDNTQKLTFQKVFATAQDKINKKSSSGLADIPVNETYYLKILCTGKNVSGAELSANDCKIKMRAKFYNKYRDMKALSSALN